MKVSKNILRKQRGIMLVECMVYVALFLILTGVAMKSFCICWDHSRTLILTTDDISAALQAGEHWRADVRDASGPIKIETTASGEVIKIPEGGKVIFYSFDSGEMRRQAATNDLPRLLLTKVKSSEMKSDLRGGVAAWKWELELAERPKGPHLPMLFTFEAAQKTP
jgi:hypothetical protein